MTENTNAETAGESTAVETQETTATPAKEANESVHPDKLEGIHEKILAKLPEEMKEDISKDNSKEKSEESVEEAKADPKEEKSEEKPTEEAQPKEPQEQPKQPDAPKGDKGEYKPTRLDKRLAEKRIEYLVLLGQTPPTKEEILAELSSGDAEGKIDSLHEHLREIKRLRNDETPEYLTQEDIEAIREEERENIRREILAEQEAQRETERIEQEKEFFLGFIEKHPELVEGKKGFDKTLYDAVNTLFKGGMRIDEAYNTVQAQFRKIAESKRAKKIQEENAGVSGVFSGTGGGEAKKLSWEDVERIRNEDPEKWRQMVKNGKLPK